MPVAASAPTRELAAPGAITTIAAATSATSAAIPTTPAASPATPVAPIAPAAASIAASGTVTAIAIVAAAASIAAATTATSTSSPSPSAAVSLTGGGRAQTSAGLNGELAHGTRHSCSRSLNVEEGAEESVQAAPLHGGRQVVLQHLEQAGRHLRLATTVGTGLALDMVGARLGTRARALWGVLERRPVDNSELEQLLDGRSALLEAAQRTPQSRFTRGGRVAVLLMVLVLSGLSARALSGSKVLGSSPSGMQERSALDPASGDLFSKRRVSASVFLHQEPVDALLHHPIPVGLGTPNCEPRRCTRCMHKPSCRNLTAVDLLKWRHRLSALTLSRARRAATCAVVGSAADGLEAADEKLIDRSQLVFRVASERHQGAGQRTTHWIGGSVRAELRAESNATLIRYCYTPSAPALTSWTGRCWRALLAGARQPWRRGGHGDELFISPLAAHDLSQVVHQAPSPEAMAVRVALEVCDWTTVFSFGASSGPAAAAERRWLQHLELEGLLSWQRTSYVRPTRT